jgi:hypothetical protein
MPDAPRTLGVITPDDLGGEPADHFAWMKMPATLASRISDWLR